MKFSLLKTVLLSLTFLAFLAVPARAANTAETEPIKTEMEVYTTLVAAIDKAEAHPHDVANLIALGQAHLEVFDRLYEKTGNSPRMCLPLSLLNLLKAQTAFEEVLTLDPQNTAAHDGLVEIFFYQRLYHKGFASCQILIAVNPESGAYHANYGELLLEEGHFEEALPQYERARDLDPTSVGARAGIIACLYALEREDEAESLYEKEMEDESLDGARLSFIVGLYLRQTFLQPSKALPYLERALELREEDPDYYVEYLAALEDLDRYQKLLSVSTQALRLYPENLDVLSFHALALMNLNRPEAALSNLQEMTRIDPGNEWATLLIYDVYSNLEMGYTIPDPNRAGGNDALAGLILRTQSVIRERYQESMEEAVERRPRDATARLNLGQALLSTGHYEEAVREYKTVLSADRRNTEALRGLVAAHLIRGFDLFQQEMYEEALTAYKEAAALNPEDLASHCFVLEFENLREKRAEIEAMVEGLMNRHAEDRTAPDELENSQTSL